jgi:hypothetical protein
MLQENHPNACNLCHTDKPIDWTLGFLKQWYGRGYDENAIAGHYPERRGPVAQGWLKSDNAAVRLVAADAVARARDMHAVPRLLDALDDPYLVNRQFAAIAVERLLNLRLDDFGYHFYQGREERQKHLADLRRQR